MLPLKRLLQTNPKACKILIIKFLFSVFTLKGNPTRACFFCILWDSTFEFVVGISKEKRIMSIHKTIKTIILLTAILVFAPFSKATPQHQPSKRKELSASLDVPLQNPVCFKTRNADEKATFDYSYVIRLYKSSFLNPSHKNSLWDQGFLKSHPHVAESLKDFKAGRIGKSVTKISLEDKSATELHKDLIKKGFRWFSVPLMASIKQKNYWLFGGDSTRDVNHPRVVKMIIYVHKDGGIVRIKPRGVPDLSAKHPRRSAHAVKAVLLSFNPDQCVGNTCDYDTSYQNESFKVSNDNQPIPKAPSPKYGLKVPFDSPKGHQKDINRLVKNVVMNLAHTNIKTNCLDAF